MLIFFTLILPSFISVLYRSDSFIFQLKPLSLKLILKKKQRNLEQIKKNRRALQAPNCLAEMLRELMDERRVEPKHIHEATGIPYSTLSEWYLGKVKVQALDGNILALARFFNVSIHYLAFGIGDDDPAFGDETPSARFKNGN